MPKGNKGNNAFYFFMHDWKKQQEAAGMSFPKGMKEVAANPRCSEDWKIISIEEKRYYQNMAKESRIQAQGTASKKTSLGELLSDVEARNKRQQEFQQNMHQYIDSVVSMGMKHNNLEKLKFIFIHVNWFFQREVSINKYDFCPAEFAVAEFSLQNSIENIYHEVLNTKIPLGWRRDAIETSQQTHQIPIELPDGQSDFNLMYNKLVSFLQANKTGNKFPPLFTEKDLKLAVESLLERMCKDGHGSMDDFQIYSLEALFGALRNAAAQNVDSCSIPLVVAEYEFGKDIFFALRGIECDFHKIIDGTSQYCSKSKVKRWGFTICDYCCEFLDIKMIEGVHCPHKLDDEDAKDTSGIENNMRMLNINTQSKIIEMNGVSEDHRRRVSERTDEEEQRRRNECKPLEIIDHSQFNSNKPILNIPARPLRLPKTKPQFLPEIEENSLFNTDDFPPIGGRGVANKRKTTNAKLPLGRGRGSR